MSSERMSHVTLAEEFLRRIWELNHPPLLPENAYVFMAAKDWTPGRGEWTERPTKYGDHPIPPTFTDLYFCPNFFTDVRRLRKNAMPGRWLYADLDEVHPDSCTALGIQPTLAWETSPGRYQAMWLLDRPLPPRRLERLNQRLTYFTGADKGGWSLTKVLRVPGSTSTKHSGHWCIPLLTGYSYNVHTVEDMEELIPSLEEVAPDSVAHPNDPKFRLPPDDELPDPDKVLRRWRRKISKRALVLLRTKNVLTSEDRSARLWELENLLIDAGLSIAEAYVLVQRSAWNKYRGQRRERRQIERELRKALSNGRTSNDTDTTPPGPSTPVLASHTGPSKPTRRRKSNSLAGLLPNTLWYDDFMNREWPKPTWLIRDTWTRGAYGILAGEYKSFKTMLALDLALSVASGTPFLGQHEVLHPGTVSYIYEEGRPWSIHDRLFRIANAKGLADTYDPASGQIDFRGRSLPISISSLPQLDLGAESSQEAVRTHIRAARPELVILETFYLLSGGVNESNIEEVSPILEFLASISHEFGCAVILTHHFHKSKEDKRFLDRVSGSSIFLRWYESGLFVERVGAESDNTIRIMSSHREGASTMSALRMLWNSEDDGQSYFVQHLDPNDPTGDVAADDAADRIIELGQATNVKEPPSTHHRKAFDNPDLKAVRRILKREITQPRPLVELKELLGKTRTEDVQSLVRSAGYRVGTIDGTRHILPPKPTG